MFINVYTWSSFCLPFPFFIYPCLCALFVFFVSYLFVYPCLCLLTFFVNILPVCLSLFMSVHLFGGIFIFFVRVYLFVFMPVLVFVYVFLYSCYCLFISLFTFYLFVYSYSCLSVIFLKFFFSLMNFTDVRVCLFLSICTYINIC